MSYQITPAIQALLKTPTGLCLFGVTNAPDALPTDLSDTFAKGCLVTNTFEGSVYMNVGDEETPVWESINPEGY